MITPLHDVLTTARSAISDLRKALPSLSEQDALKLLGMGSPPEPVKEKALPVEKTPRPVPSRKQEAQKAPKPPEKRRIRDYDVTNPRMLHTKLKSGITQSDVIWGIMGPEKKWTVPELILALVDAGWRTVYSGCGSDTVCGNLTTHPKMFVRVDKGVYRRIERPDMEVRAQAALRQMKKAVEKNKSHGVRIPLISREFCEAARSVLSDGVPRTVSELVNHVSEQMDIPWVSPVASALHLLNQPGFGFVRDHGKWTLRPSEITPTESKDHRTIQTVSPCDRGTDPKVLDCVKTLKTVMGTKTWALSDVYQAFQKAGGDYHPAGVYRILRHPQFGFEKVTPNRYRVKPSSTDQHQTSAAAV